MRFEYETSKAIIIPATAVPYVAKTEITPAVAVKTVEIPAAKETYSAVIGIKASPEQASEVEAQIARLSSENPGVKFVSLIG